MVATLWLLSLLTIFLSVKESAYASPLTKFRLSETSLGNRNNFQRERRQSLSIVNALEVLRSKLALETARRQHQMIEQKAEENRKILEKVGKRSMAIRRQLLLRPMVDINDAFTPLNFYRRLYGLEPARKTNYDQNVNFDNMRQNNDDDGISDRSNNGKSDNVDDDDTSNNRNASNNITGNNRNFFFNDSSNQRQLNDVIRQNYRHQHDADETDKRHDQQSFQFGDETDEAQPLNF